jgi:hypothetical protein
MASRFLPDEYRLLANSQANKRWKPLTFPYRVLLLYCYFDLHLTHNFTMTLIQIINIQTFGLYLTDNKSRLYYKDQPVMADKGNNRCLL